MVCQLRRGRLLADKRGQALAETAIVMYQALAASHGAGVAKGVGTEVDLFRKWEGKKKLPD